MIKKNNIFTVLLILLVLCLLIGCSKSEVGSSNYTYNYKGYSEYTYTLNEKAFSFKHPESWIVEEQPAWEASEGVEASPEWGIRVFIEGNVENTVDIFGSFSSSSITEDTSYTKKDFVVEDAKIGSIYTKKADGMVHIYVLYDKETSVGFHNAVVKVTDDFYKQHKDVIWHIIGSVKY